jgi:periplasmic divalent cation tolerance protein
MGQEVDEPKGYFKKILLARLIWLFFNQTIRHLQQNTDLTGLDCRTTRITTMMMELILCNCPDSNVAERITTLLLQRKLVACVNVLPAVQSHYIWQGKLEQSTEIPLLIKARKEDFIEIEQVICSLHPYQVPEIIAIATQQVFAPYLQWVEEVTRRD